MQDPEAAERRISQIESRLAHDDFRGLDLRLRVESCRPQKAQLGALCKLQEEREALISEQAELLAYLETVDRPSALLRRLSQLDVKIAQHEGALRRLRRERAEVAALVEKSTRA